jgi:multidrug efflux pump subunit AcrA (membrane-fusion protein)
MTFTMVLSRFRGPAISVIATTAVLSAALLLQHVRHGWPFSLHHGLPRVSVAAPVATGRTQPADHSTHNRVPVDIEAAKIQQFGARLESVNLEGLSQPLRAVATIVPDESRISHAHTRVSGWVEELNVNTTGQMVRRGEPLARIFSQELLSSQTEYLAARKNATSGPPSVVVESGRSRLKVLGMTDAEIEMIERTGEPIRLVTVVAPRSGVVIHRGISVGTAVDPSTELLTVADLSSVWILAEVPEGSIAQIKTGMRATLDFQAMGTSFPAKVTFVYPTLTERTRTLRVRLTAANPRGALKPGMYGSAEFQSNPRKVLTVPRDAIVDTGLAQHVFVATGSGRFEPREIKTGSKLAERVEIVSGLKQGERVVAAGVFLIDSESRLRASSGMTGHAHGAKEADSGGPATAPDAHSEHEE